MKDEDMYIELGGAIKERRKALKLTQEKLSVKLGISRTALTNIEAGRQRLHVHKLCDISMALDLDVQDLIPKEYFKRDEPNDSKIILSRKGLSRKQRDQILDLI